MTAPAQTELQREWLTYAEAQTVSGLGRTTLWRLVSAGNIRAARSRGLAWILVFRRDGDRSRRGRALLKLPTVVKLSSNGTKTVRWPIQSIAVLPARRHFSGVGDAEFEPATSAV